ncbi:MAG: diaminopimelate epimerase [Rhodospirillales bacterium]|nr:diaminopimelate epimerase [Rhodospirillales bacterium]
MMLRFKKMHGLGNDFIIIDQRQNQITLPTEAIRRLANRKRGIGCDQLVVMEASEKADVFMRIYNADGGEVGACGNATRCVAHIVMKEQNTEQCTIETVSGILECKMEGDHAVTVNMGAPRLSWQNIPLSQEMDTMALSVQMAGLEPPLAVNIGNPHCIFIVDNVETAPLEQIGPVMEKHPLFPERTNVELIQVLEPRKLRVRVWERGCGVTESCGTGACASLVAAVRKGLCRRNAEIILDGGSLSIEWRREDDHILMTGPIAYVFEGAV